MNLGLEWRVSSGFGIKVDGGYSDWYSGYGYRIHSIMYINPELRVYMGYTKRWYLGAGASFADLTFKPNDMGYDGTMTNVGAVIGYQVPLGRSLSMDLNLGLGYVGLKYDTFTGNNDNRIPAATGVTKDLFGPTQAGVSLVWRMGR